MLGNLATQIAKTWVSGWDLWREKTEMEFGVQIIFFFLGSNLCDGEMEEAGQKTEDHQDMMKILQCLSCPIGCSRADCPLEDACTMCKGQGPYWLGATPRRA